MNGADVEDLRERLRERLAQAGVPLFQPTPVGVAPLGDSGAAMLLVDLLRCGDARLVASIPCVLALHPGAAPQSSSLTAPESATFGFLHYVARGLVASRSPDLSQIFGLAPRLSPCDAEPHGLPDADRDFGDAALAAARDRDAPATGDAVTLFDKWLRMVALERRSREPARSH